MFPIFLLQLLYVTNVAQAATVPMFRDRPNVHARTYPFLQDGDQHSHTVNFPAEWTVSAFELWLPAADVAFEVHGVTKEVIGQARNELFYELPTNATNTSSIGSIDFNIRLPEMVTHPVVRGILYFQVASGLNGSFIPDMHVENEDTRRRLQLENLNEDIGNVVNLFYNCAGETDDVCPLITTDGVLEGLSDDEIRMRREMIEESAARAAAITSGSVQVIQGIATGDTTAIASGAFTVLSAMGPVGAILGTVGSILFSIFGPRREMARDPVLVLLE